ncbi:choline/glycine/proline betaine transport protein [Haloechinothrix alba]|uniref:Choline/glycine/proline betaine transport protein n=1 Tax=Haloechinothrix alba TaxID=664784 RepID=A0A238V2I7_9PSEU|nr:choline/glycine/proline betaine transport protein [Haloechinothrix alba]
MATTSDTSPDPAHSSGPANQGAWYQSVKPGVFWPSVIIIVVFALWAVFAPDTANEWLGEVSGGITQYFSWYYNFLVTAFVVFAIWVGVGHFGDIKLSPQDEEPEFSVGSWLAMLFAAGMGIGLVFFGVAEPLMHFDSPKPGVEGSPTELAEFSMIQTFLHWGLHPWAIYVVVGLAIAYMVHRKGKPISIRWVLQPLLGNRVKGVLGDVIDIAAVIGTVFGVATSLGLGVLQIAAGLEWINIIQDPGDLVYAVLIGLITAVAIVSVVTGVKRGIKWLSNFNISLAALIMLFVLVAGPTMFVLREFVQSIGLYLQNLLQMSFDTTAMQGSAGIEWQGFWQAFYWGWWISWAPFVGVFIARISRGRTVREFVGGVLLVPTIVTFFWFSVLGGSGLYREIFGDGGIIDAEEGVTQEGALFGLLETLPAGTILVGLAVLLIATFFITSSDSGSLVVDMLSSGGHTEPPKWSRIFWATAEGIVAIALLLAGGQAGLEGLRSAAIIIALPFSVVMILMCISTWRAFTLERRAFLRVQRRQQREELTEQVSQSLIDEGLVEPNDASGSTPGSGSGSGSGTGRT